MLVLAMKLNEKINATVVSGENFLVEFVNREFTGDREASPEVAYPVWQWCLAVASIHG